MILRRVNWTDLQNRLDSCRYMSEAGVEEKAQEMLHELCEEVIELLDKK
jgi:hypothetical protein